MDTGKNQKKIIYEECVDPEYESTDEGNSWEMFEFLITLISEIREYAKFLGMDPDVDKNFIWIAKQGLKAPLPEGWKAM
jgi:centrosomal protein CEP164